MKTRQAFILLAFAVSAAACKKESALLNNTSAQDSKAELTTEQPAQSFNPANFVSGINNPYLPFVPGTSFYYLNTTVEGAHLIVAHVTVDVTKDIKVIRGVNCEVVHDYVKEKGIITEDTYDWYAQDKEGNVWYFGESTRKLTDTGWSTLGSWEAGVNGAEQGIIMHAKPRSKIGEAYYQEFYKNFAEDQAVVLNDNANVIIALGTFGNCVKTKEFTRLAPGDISNKYYAAGIGEILTLETKGVNVREELVKIVHHY